MLILLVLAPYAGKVPLAALAAILFLVAWNMSEARRFLRMVRQAPRADVAILLITFVLTIVTDLVVAVNIGVILAMFQFMRRMSASVSVVEHGQASLRHELAEAGLEALPRDVLVYAIEGPFFFGSVDSLERALSWSREPPRWVLLRLERVPLVDATGLKRLESTIENLRGRGVQVLLSGANLRVLRKLVRAEIVSARRTRRLFRRSRHRAAPRGRSAGAGATAPRTRSPPGANARRGAGSRARCASSS